MKDDEIIDYPEELDTYHLYAPKYDAEGKTLNIKRLIEAVHEECGYTEEEMRDVYRALITQVYRELEKGNNVLLDGLIRITLHNQKPRKVKSLKAGGIMTMTRPMTAIKFTKTFTFERFWRKCKHLFTVKE